MGDIWNTEIVPALLLPNAPSAPPFHAFDDFELDTRAFQLRKGGVPVPMEPQVFEVLALLVQNEGRVVTKDELLDRVWPERYVTEAALNSRVMSARKALGDNGQAQRYIKTVHGRGYRFSGAEAVAPKEPFSIRERTKDTADEEAAAHPPIRYATTRDGSQVAYAVSGGGVPLVRVLGWFTHVDLEWRWPALRDFWARLGRRHQLVRYDGRGMGLSSHADTFSMESRIADLEAVVEHSGLDRFALLGMCEGADTAVHYSARHPQRVTHLVTYGAGPSGPNSDPSWTAGWNAVMQLICEGWDHQSPVYRQVFAHLFLGANARPEAVRAFDELQRTAVSGEQALRYLQSLDSDGRRESDLSEAARSLKVPSLVIHRRNDPLVPLDHSRRLAAAIPGARFISLGGDARWLMVDEAANGEFIAAIEHFTSVRS